ncbi:MAG: hypothetical protein EZS28_021899 [Streblomastix strix]|uniref:Uncharacterized protein n=1 Tax=Streblomastix strix TaxID=222440 RepID=A0A5J4VK24_9EUKA|nr:MAG: hypothetical protein EZS28_021899 [Streblomastix strix]
MAVPKEYNVIDGLPGLGPDVLLYVLSEIRLISNAVQFLGVCNKIYQLMNHDRFNKIIETLNYPIEIVIKDPDCIQLINIDGVQKKINQKKSEWHIISLIRMVENGIWSLEAMFQNTEEFGTAIGIVRDSYDIPSKACYTNQPHTDHIAAFCGGCLYPVWYKGQGTKRNDEFKDHQIVKLEFDSYKGTLILFIDNVQQPVYFSGIKEKVRFIISMFNNGSSCTILSLKQLIDPTSKQIANQLIYRELKNAESFDLHFNDVSTNPFYAPSVELKNKKDNNKEVKIKFSELEIILLQQLIPHASVIQTCAHEIIQFSTDHEILSQNAEALWSLLFTPAMNVQLVATEAVELFN